MAGHSHWAGIKHKKAMIDNKRGKLWSKLSKAIIIAAKMGGRDTDTNIRLRTAITDAKAVSMPKDNIERAIKKGTGELESASYEDVLYEGYGNSGVAVMCKAVTDNRNRTSAEIKKLFERAGGNLGASNCVAFQFKQKGVIVVAKDKADEDRIMEVAIEAGAEDVESSEHIHEIVCAAESLEDVRQAIVDAGIEPESADLSMVADNIISLDLDKARKVMRLINALDDHDDVEAVYSNSTMSDDVVAQLGKE